MVSAESVSSIYSSKIFLFFLLKQAIDANKTQKRTITMAPIPITCILKFDFGATYIWPLPSFAAACFWIYSYRASSNCFKLLPSFKALATHFLYLASVISFSGSGIKSALPFSFIYGVTIFKNSCYASEREVPLRAVHEFHFKVPKKSRELGFGLVLSPYSDWYP